MCGSGQALAAHAARLRTSADYAHVAIGYLNYCRPFIEEAVADCIANGAERIIVSPYFLVAGKFVRVDLPARLQTVEAQYPQVEFVMAQPLGDTPAMGEVVRELLGESTSSAQWQSQALDAARLRCERRTDCPLYGSIMCQITSQASAESQGQAAPGMADTAVTASPRNYKLGVLMVLHGSPRPEANQPALEIAQKLRQSRDYDYAEVAYLECNEPDIPTALAAADHDKVSHLKVLPYFLHLGRHQVIDVPGLLIDAENLYPAMEISLCSPVGASPLLARALLRRIDEVKT